MKDTAGMDQLKQQTTEHFADSYKLFAQYIPTLCVSDNSVLLQDESSVQTFFETIQTPADVSDKLEIFRQANSPALDALISFKSPMHKEAFVEQLFAAMVWRQHKDDSQMKTLFQNTRIPGVEKNRFPDKNRAMERVFMKLGPILRNNKIQRLNNRITDNLMPAYLEHLQTYISQTP